QLIIQTGPQFITDELISFFEDYMKKNPGKSLFKFIISDEINKWKAQLISAKNGIDVNEELIGFLEKRSELEVQVITA
ncbi:MAG: hypothetical protein N2747_07920, partial [Chitinophagaceae bacterium]|nr:hypothetical protein [Chitinophagaceae bacterium]